ncbi:hypothetical protein FJTKL_01167 [Diaporthe vaccinii]|uniref:Uncharacterized protein n=1 Tax=Diaporthe vaccinii TaxID=105482 RepID=A0ABR4F5Q3_9PEZI
MMAHSTTLDKITAIQGVASNIIDVNIPQSGNQGKKGLLTLQRNALVLQEIAFLVGQNGQGSLRASLKIAAKANWRKRRLDRMEKALSDAEQLMQSTLMAWIFKSANMASINIHSLGHELRDFVIKYEHGSTQTSQLVASEAFKVREVVVRQSGETEEALRAHVTRTSANLERKFEHQIKQDSRKWLLDSLLKSLKYYA